MKREEFRSIISDQFYRSLGQSEVKLNSIPHAELQAIVAAMADGVATTRVALSNYRKHLQRTYGHHL